MDPYFTTREDQGYSVIQFQTDSLMNPLDLEKIGLAIYRLIDLGNHHRILLDFSKVRYLSSQAIGIILTLNKKLSQFQGSALVLCAVGQQLMQLLKITRLDKLLKIVGSQEEVLGAAEGAAHTGEAI